MHSQNDEEQVILEYFGEFRGTFYDIGAWDGKCLSNTYALLERGWAGVMVEPAPRSFVGLMENTEPFRDRVQLVNAAITVEGGLRPFYDCKGDAVATLDIAHRDKWETHTGKMREMAVNTLSIKDLFATFGAAEFINLDVEGTNAELFGHLPISLANVRMVCVEHDGHYPEMEAAAAQFGYQRLLLNGENLILARGA